MALSELQPRIEGYLTERLGGPQAVTDLRLLARGWEADAYAFRLALPQPDLPPSLVLRLYPAKNAGPRAAIEAHTLQALNRLGYSVPRFSFFEPDPARFGGPAIFMEMVAGQHLWEAHRPEPHGPAALAALCGLMLSLHRLDAAGLATQAVPGLTTGATAPSFSVPFIAEISAAAGILEPFRSLFDLLGELESRAGRRPVAIIHGDLHLENVLVDQSGRSVVIDWSAAGIDDPRVDVAQTVVLLTTNGRPQAGAAFLAEYERQSGRPLANMAFFRLLTLARRFLSVAATLRMGSAAIGLRPGLETELRKGRVGILAALETLREWSGLRLPGAEASLDLD